MALTAEEREKMARRDGPIHHWFGLSYCNYAVQPRSVMQSMPVDWQQRFVDLMNEAEEMGYAWPAPPGAGYQVCAKGGDGRFVKDPLRHYRHTFIEPEVA